MEGETVPFFCSWPRRGGVQGLPGLPVVLLRPLVTYLGVRHSMGLTCLGSLPAHLSLGVTPAVGSSTTHKAVHFSPVLDV